MLELNSTPGRTCMINDKKYLFFSGYAYLGMGHINEFTNLIKEGIDKYGVLFPSSRISNTKFTLYNEFENSLSVLTGMEDTVSFSSGFLAGKAVANLISSYGNIFVAPGTHPAINPHPEQELTTQHFNKWAEKITNTINTSLENDFFIVSDSINILESKIQNFSFLLNIADQKKLVIIIDDSHGIGLLGERGEGIVSLLPQKENFEYIISYSLSKAFNIQGGAVSCSKYWSNKLRQHPNYTGSTSISPPMIYAFLNCQALYKSQREKLFKNISFLKNKNELSLIGKNENDLPIFICSKPNAEDFFLKKNIIISSFAYPYPDSSKVERIVLNALHTFDDIEQLCFTA